MKVPDPAILWGAPRFARLLEPGHHRPPFPMRIPNPLADRIVPRVLASAQAQATRRPLVVEHHLHGVSPEQITWWWGHIDTTERYRRWHPQDHLSFAWEVAPRESHIGTVQVVREGIGLLPATLRIRFDDPAATITAFSHLLVATIISAEGLETMRFTHAYESVAGGTHMRSTFHLPPLLYRLLGAGLRRHCREEMANLSQFLPALYVQERAG
jgi:DAPG hydrolase PhiG domain